MLFSHGGKLPDDDEEVDSEWESPARARAQRYGESLRTGAKQKKPKRPPMFRMTGTLQPRLHTDRTAINPSVAELPSDKARKWNLMIEKEATEHDGFADNVVSLTELTTGQYNSLMRSVDLWPHRAAVENKRKTEASHFEPIDRLYIELVSTRGSEPSTPLTSPEATQSFDQTFTAPDEQSLDEQEEVWGEWVG